MKPSKELHERWMKNPVYREEYENLEDEFSSARESSRQRMRYEVQPFDSKYKAGYEDKSMNRLADELEAEES